MTYQNAAQKYYEEGQDFTQWFKTNIANRATGTDSNGVTMKNALTISSTNDPDNENSYFTQHKRAIMKDKIEHTLSSSIFAYTESTGQDYKMPALRGDDWEKVYDNIAVITFVQGMPMGFKTYNNYCVLNSTNSQEYVNADLIYFSDGIEYHDIRCPKALAAARNGKLVGYKIGNFEKAKATQYIRKTISGKECIQCTVTNTNTNSTTTLYEYNQSQYLTDSGVVKYTRDYGQIIDASGRDVTDTIAITRVEQDIYYYAHPATACYDCINGNLNTSQSVYEYVRSSSTNSAVKRAYFTALARERMATPKLMENYAYAYNADKQN